MDISPRSDRRPRTLGVLFLLAIAAGPLTASNGPRRDIRALSDFSGAIEDLAQSASGAVVQITSQTRAPFSESLTRHTGYLASQQSTGSGAIIDASGYIVTNAHVIDGARNIDVSVLDRESRDAIDNHKHYAARLIGTDRETDLALIKIEENNLPALGFRDSATLRQGQFVVALGSPLGLENSLTVGFVSATARRLRQDSPMFYIQTDAAINPGNSGGPLLDVDGRIAGINTMIMSQSGGSEGIGFAIPSNLVVEVCEHLRAEGRVRRGQIGVIPENVTPMLAKALDLSRLSGVILSDVAPHSSAEAAGLRTGDLVLAANGSPMKDAQQFMAVMFQRAVGDRITIEIERGRERLTKTVAVMERPSSPRGLMELANQEGEVINRLGVLALNLDEVSAVVPEPRRLSGVVVGAIPAECASLNPGLAAGDVIYEMNGKRVVSIDDLKTSLAVKNTGDPVALLVERNSQLLYVSFEI